MKIKNLLLTGIGACAMLMSSTLFAASPNSAVVLKDGDHPVGCFSSVPGSGFPVHTTDRIHTTKTKDGNVVLTCHFDVPADQAPDKAVKQSGFPCGIYLPGGSVLTSNTMKVANPGGQMTMRCQVKANQLP